MPYKGQPYRILGGSVNLNPPGSEIGPHEAQKLINATYDAAGNIRIRKDHSSICGLSNVSDMIKALSNRWQGVDLAKIIGYQKFIWKTNPGTANKDCSVVISSGDGMRKSDGSNDWRWTIRPPTAKPTAKAAALAQTLISGPSGWDIDPCPASEDDGDPDTEDCTDFDGTFFSEGDETYALTKDISIDLETGFNIDDVHKITLWCKQWKKVEGVSFEVDCNNGDFTTDAFVCKMDLVNRIIGKRDEAVFYVRKRPFGVDKYALDKKRYGHFLRIGSTPEKGWKTVTKLRIKIDFSATTKFRLPDDLWQLVGDEDSTLEGDDYVIYQTFRNAAGHESNPGPGSDPITCNRAGIEVTGLQHSSDPQVTGSNIYISGGTFTLIYRVNGSGDDETNKDGITGSSYSITQSEDDITALGIEMDNDNDDAPLAKVIAGPYYDRILLAQTAEHPERLFWSKQAKPYGFPGSDQAIGNWNDVGMTGEKILAITLRPHSALIYKENSVWALVGDPGELTGAFQETAAQMGISSPNGVVKAGTKDYAHMSEGIYEFRGGDPVKISQKIDPIFKGRAVQLSDGTSADIISDPTTTAIGYRDNVVWFSYTGSSGRKTIKYDVETQRWFSDSRGFDCFYYEGQNGKFVGALSSGGIVSLEDGGGSVELDFLSKDYDLDSPDHNKTWEDFTIETLVSGLTVTAHFNGRMPDAITVPLGVTTGGRDVFRIIPDGRGQLARTCAIRVHGTAPTNSSINKLIFNVAEAAREGKTYDTVPFDAGTAKIKLVREMFLDIHNPQTAVATLYTDQPGFIMTAKDSSASFAASSERRGERHVFGQDFYGHLMRLIVLGNDIQVYGARVLLQVVGTYLFGSRNEFWSSDQIDFGTERIKMIKEIEAVYSGGGLLSIESDLPGTGPLAVRAINPLTTASLEETRKMRLSGLFLGRLWRFKVNPFPASDMRLETLRVYMKILGEHGATPWHWVNLPVTPSEDAQWHELAFGKDVA